MNEVVAKPVNTFNVTMARDIERRQKLAISDSLKEIHRQLQMLSDKIDSLQSNAKPAGATRAKKD